jgi:VCBS repeat-containing protein
MNLISEYFKQSELALAAYANHGSITPDIPDLKRVGMSRSQATRFSENWRVAAPQFNHTSGLSVTVFEEVSTGKRYLVIRGTNNDRADVWTDIVDIAILGTPERQAQYAALRAKVQEWRATEVLPASFSVAGHSLGGFLAGSLLVDYPLEIEHAYLYNAPGVGGLQAALRLLLGLEADPSLDLSRVSNLRADAAVSPIAGLGFAWGAPIEVAIEAQFNPLANHSIVPLTDALALHAAYAGLAPALTLSESGALLRASSARNALTLESALDALRLTLLGEAAVLGAPSREGDREAFYGNLYGLLDSAAYRALAGTAPLRVLAQADAPAPAAEAASDFGKFLALRHLLPFALEGAGSALIEAHADLYARWSADRARRIAGAAELEFTDAYLSDRADMLSWKLARNKDDLTIVPDVAGAPRDYVDRRVQTVLVGGVPTEAVVTDKVWVGGGISRKNLRQIAFGSDKADALQGFGFADRLYGGAGDDSLNAQGGDDHLEGGAGADGLSGGFGDDTLIGGADDDALRGGAGDDVYQFYFDGGHDTITDSRENGSQVGQIWFNDERVLGTGESTSADGKTFSLTGTRGGVYTFTFTGNESTGGILNIFRAGDPSIVTVQGFRSGDFGIELGPVAPVPKTDKFGTAQSDNSFSTQPGHASTLAADSPDQRAIGLAGNDRIIVAQAGAIALGGAGHDYITDGAGEQRLYGDRDDSNVITGTGNDILIAGAGADELYGDGGNDALQGGADDDVLQGGDGDDFLDGGAGSDAISGGDGNDFILGGGTMVPTLGEGELDDPNGRPFGVLFQDDVAGFQNMAGFLLAAGDAANAIDAGAGNDTVLGGEAEDHIEGGGGDDLLAGMVGQDAILGGDGADFIVGDGTEGTLTVGGQAVFTLPEFHAADYLDGGEGNDSLTGDGGADELYGGAGDDLLIGDATGLDEQYHGADWLDGGEGRDTLFGYGKDDMLFGGAGDDLLEGDSSDTPFDKHGNDYLDGEAGDDVVKGDGGADTLFGGDGADQLFGDTDDTPVADQGDDYLDGEAGDDYLRAYAGNDTLYGGEGADQMLGEAGFDYLDGEAGNDLMSGGEGDDTLIGGLGDDDLQGGAGNDFLDGGDGNDLVAGGDDADVASGGAGDDQVAGDAGDDTLFGDDGVDTLFGDAGADQLFGGAGNDTLLGGLGNDLLDGGEGDDRYVYAPGGGIDRIADSGGNDTLVMSGLSFGTVALSVGSLVLRVGSNEVHIEGFDPGDPAGTGAIELFQFDDGLFTYEQLLAKGFDLTGTPDADVILGTPLADHVNALEGDDTVEALGGDDRVLGGAGNDSIEGGEGNDTLHGELGDDALSGGAGEDIAFGGAGADTLAGGAGRDFLNGEEDDDVLDGGEDGDFLNGGAGADLVRGQAGNDALVGGTGADLMAGGPGDDTYFVDDPADLVLENAAEGHDTVNSELRTYSLPAHVEDLTISGIGGTAEASGNDLANVITLAPQIGDATLRGLAGDDALYGALGNDTLDGGEGSDTLAGGFGDDTYYADEDGDLITEFLDSGVDRVYSSAISFDLPSEVEHLTLVEGSGAISGLGNILGNTITGNSGDNFLAGELQVAYAGVDPGVGADTLLGLGGNDELDGWIGDDALEGGEGDDLLYGRAGADTLAGGEGADLLDGSTLVSIGFFGTTVIATDDGAIDILMGGPGDDTYLIGDADDVITENPGEGDDTVEAVIDYSLPANVENLLLTGDAPLVGEGNAQANLLVDDTFFLDPFGRTELYGLGGDDVLENGTFLDGGEGVDTMIGRPGSYTTYIVDNPADVVSELDPNTLDEVFSSVTYTAPQGVENLTLTGAQAIDGYGNELQNRLTGNDAPNRLEDAFGVRFEGVPLPAYGDSLFGMGGDDTLLAASGPSLLDGGAGADWMAGGTEDDIYVVDDAADTIFENAGEGYDTVRSSVTYTLSDHVEELRLEGAAAIDGTGSDNALEFNRLVGNDAPNMLSGRAGADELIGNGGDDTLAGGEGADVLDGGAGADAMAGGQGDDLYRVDDPADTVTEAPGEGYDRVESSIAFTLADNVEALALQGEQPLSGVGNDAANEISGNVAANLLAGLGGADALDGGAGNDQIDGGDGDDALFGGADAAEGSGGAGEGGGECVGDACPPPGGGILPNADFILGGAGNDRIDGGSGADELHGEAGDDLLYGGADGGVLDPFGGFVVLPNNDRLYGEAGDDVLDGGSGFDELFGGEGADRLFGGADFSDDLLDGGSGIDFMAGGPGGDTYFVDGSYEVETFFEVDECGDPVERQALAFVADTVFENPFEGTDTVYATVSYTLPADVENLFLQAPFGDPVAFADLQRFGMDGAGNALANQIIGNLFANRLDGGAGADFLAGGFGDDTYVIDSSGDQISEAFGQGTDTVETTLQNYMLAANLENLTFLDNGSTLLRTGAGTGSANVLRGAATRESLNGFAGDDTLAGGAGNDFLQGGEGNDTYLFGRGDGVDFVSEFSGLDTVKFLAGIAPQDLAFSTSGGNYVIDIAGTGDRLVLFDWINAPDHVERLVFCDGTVLDKQEMLAALNRPPVVANPVPDQATLEDAAYAFTVPADAFADPDAGDTLALSASLADGSALPAWLSFDAASGTFAGTPANADVGGYEIRLLAEDGRGGAAEDRFVLTVLNVNDAPVTMPDAAAVSEDGIVSASGNVLANDSDIDAGSVLAVANPGTFAGSYGTLELSAEGAYTYTLDSASRKVQSLAAGASVIDAFTYAATDGIASVTGALAVTVAGANDAPVLVTPIADRSVDGCEPFSFALPADAFTDVDAGDLLGYSATLASGDPLPSWLAFDPATRTFTGDASGTDAATLSIRISATDTQGASAFDSFDLAITSGQGGNIVGTDGDDVLTGTPCDDVIDGGKGFDRMAGGRGDDIYFVDRTCADDDDDEHGNEGIGNGEDPPPPGHEENQNDGLGTSPGHPGSRERHAGGGHRDDRDHHGDGHGHHAHQDDDDGDHDDDHDDDEHDEGEQCRLDEVIERPDGGYDTVFAAADYTLPANVEALVLTGEEDLEGRGNALANVVAGNSGDNRLAAGEGDDVYLYELGGGEDAIEEAGGNDTLRLGAGIAPEALRLKRRHDDLVLELKGDDGSVTVKGWFASEARRIERIEFADGTAWNEDEIGGRLGKPARHKGASESAAFWAGAQAQDGGCEAPGVPGHGAGQGMQDEPEPERPIDWFRDRPERPYRFEFEAILQAIGRGDSHRALAPEQAARQWARVWAHAERLAAVDEDEALRGAPLGWHSFSLSGLLGSGGVGFGFEGSTGAARGPQGFKIFEGLREGFDRL